MKKIIIYITILFILNCCKQHRNFDGIGEIKLGKDFESISSSTSFTKVSENEFKIDSFKLSDKVGYVKDLSLKTINGKIYDVNFSSGKNTNKEFIDSLMKRFHRFNLVNIVKDKSSSYQFFEESDGDVDFSKIVAKDGSQPIRYKYFDIKKLVDLVDAKQ